jgi:calpain-7
MTIYNLLEFSDCRKYFPGYYLNWNPHLFSYRTVTHDHWQLSGGPLNDTFYVGDNPQFTLVIDNNQRISNTTSQTVWVLLSRHVKNRPSKTEKSKEKDEDRKDFLALHVHKLQVPHRLYGQTNRAIQGVLFFFLIFFLRN